MPRGLRNIHLSFDAGGITRYGGLVIFQQFCKSLGLRRFLQKQVDWPSHTERKFHPADLFLAHLFAIVAGIGRIENTKVLNLDLTPEAVWRFCIDRANQELGIASSRTSLLAMTARWGFSAAC